MSGTLSRGDGGRIPLVAYDENQEAKVHIRYNRRDALKDRAILPLSAKRFDGRAFYEHRGQSVTAEISTAPHREQARALKTALLDHDWVETLVMEAMRDWDQYRRTVYASKAIVVCHSQDRAKKAMRIIARNFPDARPVLALCDEPGSDQRIRDFRRGPANVLVTVKKAYEGLDVVDATHLVYLGDARTTEFLDQVFARVTRVNYQCGLPWEQQEARIFVPDDRKTREYLDKLFEEQAETYSDGAEGQERGGCARHSSFRPERAEHTAVGFSLNETTLDERVVGLIAEMERNEPATRALPLRTKVNLVNLFHRAEQHV
jgi:superfamily II DNA or RNA helicase